MMVKWCEQNGMYLNPLKVKMINFNKKRDNSDMVVKISDKVIEQVDSIKSLGVILDSELNMDQQVDNVTGKAKSALNKIAILMKGRKGITVELGVKLYKTTLRTCFNSMGETTQRVSNQRTGESPGSELTDYYGSIHKLKY